MKNVLVALFFVLFSTASVAQTLTVRAGEHDNFTRVVVPIPENIEWQIGRTEAGYSLRLSQEVEFETDGFFAIIPKDRINEVSAAANGTDLAFELACQCRATAFMTTTRWLVIDIANGEPDPESPFELAFVETISPPPAPTVTPVTRPEDLVPKPETRPSVTDELTSVESALPIITEREDQISDFEEHQLIEQAEQSDRLNQLEQAVAASLGRALSQGLLELADTPTDQSSTEDLNALQQLLADVAKIQGPGIEARTSLDVGLNLDGSVLSEAPNQFQCGRPSDFDIPSWGNEDPFTEQLATKRNGLLGEFDRPNSDAIENLARLYIYFGFGREAVAVLSIDDFDSTERRNLESMAAIMDGDIAPNRDFVALMQCDAPMDFWAMLAHENGPLPYPIDGNSIAGTFRDLPDHLQKHLAPRVAEKMRQSGQTETARIVLQIALEGPSISTEAAIEETQLLLTYGEEQQAIDALEDLTRDDGRTSPETFIQLLDLKIKEGVAISEEELAQLRVMQFEQPNQDVQVQLGVLEVRALQHMGYFEEALDNLKEIREEIPPQAFFDLNAQLLRRMVADASDVPFLNLAFRESFADVPAELQNEVAQRLIELGFIDRAETLVADQTVGTAMTERRYVRAEISAARGEVQRLQAELAGMNSARANEILSRVGIQQAAVTGENSEDAAWRDSNWEALSETSDPLLRSAAERALSAPADPLETAAPLQATESLIADSAELRQTVSGLLDRFEIP